MVKKYVYPNKKCVSLPNAYRYFSKVVLYAHKDIRFLCNIRKYIKFEVYRKTHNYHLFMKHLGTLFATQFEKKFTLCDFTPPRPAFLYIQNPKKLLQVCERSNSHSCRNFVYMSLVTFREIPAFCKQGNTPLYITL